MLELWVLRLIDKDNPDDNTSAEQISLKPEFRWFVTEEFRKLRECGREGSRESFKADEKLKEKLPLSNEEFLISDNSSLSDNGAAFWNMYDKLEDEQKGLRNHMEVDKSTVSGWELKQRLVSSGLFYTSDAQIMIEEMVSKGELKEVTYDTYTRESTNR
jgi:hypothetical protein